MMMTREISLQDYLSLGWALLPACAPAENGSGCRQHGPDCKWPGKRPLVDWKRYQRKAPSAKTVKRWAKKWPDANWGTLTGAPSGIVVLDLDSTAAHHKLGEFPLTATTKTSRGQHTYFAVRKRIPPSLDLAEDVEVKGAKGFVILPPSRHPSGINYTWARPPDQGIAPLPSWVWEMVTEAKKQRRGQPKLPTEAVVNGVRQGRRNTAAAQMAGVLLCRFEPELWESHCWPLLVAWNERCRPPLSLEELRSVFDKIAAREAKQRIKRAENLLRDKRNQDLARRIAERLHQDPELSRAQLSRILNGYRYPTFGLLCDFVQLQRLGHDAFGVAPSAPNSSRSPNDTPPPRLYTPRGGVG